ncbi:MAG: response regulator [Calditrichia bacterium]
MRNNVKILVADDHPIFRQGLSQILQGYSKKAIVHEASDAGEIDSQLNANEYDLVLLDISMPGKNGLEILDEIKKERPDTKVLIISMYSEEQYAVQAIKAGASGYLTKAGAARELITAMDKIVDGGMYISPGVAEQLAFQLKEESNKKMPRELLSSREFQVLELISKGLGIKEIASELKVSTSTVSTHRARLLTKLNMKTNADIIRYAIKEKLIEMN